MTDDNEMIDGGESLVSGPRKEKYKETYIVGSFNDWMPVRMKTIRELSMEKINPDEPIPKQIFVMDNVI